MKRESFEPLDYWRAGDELPAAAAKLLRTSPEGVIGLPSEFVLLPRQTGLVFDTARFWSSAELGITHTKTADSESWLPHVLLEHWENRGDDGHTVYQLIGHAVLTDAAARAYRTAALAALHFWDFPAIKAGPTCPAPDLPSP